MKVANSKLDPTTLGVEDNAAAGASLLQFITQTGKNGKSSFSDGIQAKMFKERTKQLTEELRIRKVNTDCACEKLPRDFKLMWSLRSFVPEMLIKLLAEKTRNDCEHSHSLGSKSTTEIMADGVKDSDGAITGLNTEGEETKAAEEETGGLEKSKSKNEIETARSSSDVKGSRKTQGLSLQPFVHPTQSAVVLADLSGFTRESERLCSMGRLGLDELGKVMYSAFSKLLNTFHGHGGDVIKFAGDALIVCWAKSKDETAMDNAIRAIQCAFELATGPQVSDRMQLHVGISVGDIEIVVVGHPARQEFSCFISGKPLVEMGVACDTAKGGQVVLHPSCYNIVKDRIVAESVGDTGCMEVKSITEGLKQRPLKRYRMSRYNLDNLVRFVPYTFQIGTKIAQETRDVIILFIKLEGPLIEAILNGVKSASHLQDIFFTMSKILERSGGMMRQFLVDDKGVVMIAAFGVPNFVHGDDPFRALDCALNISSTLETNLSVITHIGITSGRAFCGFVGIEVRREYVIIGDTVNLAARLMALSSKHRKLPTSPKKTSTEAKSPIHHHGARNKSRVICDERTRHVILNSSYGSHFVFTDLDTVKLKGKKGVVQAYIVNPATAQCGFNPLSTAEELCLGRDNELEEVKNTLESPHLRAVAFCASGAAGTGKTTFLFSALRKAADAGLNPVYSSSIHANVGNPYSAFVRIMRQVLPPLRVVGIGADSADSSFHKTVGRNQNDGSEGEEETKEDVSTEGKVCEESRTKQGDDVAVEESKEAEIGANEESKKAEVGVTEESKEAEVGVTEESKTAEVGVTEETKEADTGAVKESKEDDTGAAKMTQGESKEADGVTGAEEEKERINDDVGEEEEVVGNTVPATDADKKLAQIDGGAGGDLEELDSDEEDIDAFCDQDNQRAEEIVRALVIPSNGVVTLEQLHEAMRSVDSNTWTVDAWDPDTGDIDSRNAPSYTEQMYKMLHPLFVNEYVVVKYLKDTILALDNVHLVDDCSWTLIDELLRFAAKLQNVRFGLVMSCISFSKSNQQNRSKQVKDLVAHLDRTENCRGVEFKITPLSDADIKAMLIYLFPQDEATINSEGFMEYIQNTSEGNPFMAKELTQGFLKRQGKDDEEDEDGELGRQIRCNSTVGVSSTIERAIVARIDELSVNAKTVLSVASVIGKDFLYVMLRNLLPPTFRVTMNQEGSFESFQFAQVLRQLCPNASAITELDAALAELLSGEFITRVDGFQVHGKNKEEQRFMFTHGLILIISYNLMVETEKKRRHKRAARWIETTYQDDLRPYFVRLMLHYYKSGETVKAADYAMRAIRMTIRAGALGEATELFNFGLEMILNDRSGLGKLIKGMKLFLTEFSDNGDLQQNEKRLSINTAEVVTANLAVYKNFTKVKNVFAGEIDVDDALEDKYNFGNHGTSRRGKKAKWIAAETAYTKESTSKLSLVKQMLEVLEDMTNETPNQSESKQQEQAGSKDGAQVAAAAGQEADSGANTAAGQGRNSDVDTGNKTKPKSSACVVS